MREQEKPTFAPGDRFRLMRRQRVLVGLGHIIVTAGMKGRVTDKFWVSPEHLREIELDRASSPAELAEIAAVPLREGYFMYTAELDTYPAQEAVLFDLDEIAAKAMEASDADS